jgi:hypothetical protein
MLNFLTKHFLVISSLSLVVSAALSMILLGAYLSVFDWNLIWLVEYADLTKLFLIGVAIFSSIATTLIHQIQDAYAWLVKGAKEWKWAALTAVIVTILIQAALVFYDVRNDTGLEAYHVFRAGSSIAFFLLLFTAFYSHARLMKGDWFAIMNVFAAFVFLSATLGSTFAYYVKDASKSAREIWTKDEKFTDAKIIMLLSHHLAFVSHKKIFVIPMTDVTRIASQIAD